MRKVLVTGSKGFIGRNLLEGLQRAGSATVKTFDRGEPFSKLEGALTDADIIYHLAGVNRPEDDREFEKVNTQLTREVIAFLEKIGRAPRVVFASSTQAELDNPYGRSKKAAENILIEFSRKTRAKIHLYRLPGVFGKWSRPDYNSVVATLCYNISHGLEISLSGREKKIDLVYIDDVVNEFVGLLQDTRRDDHSCYHQVKPSYTLSLGNLAEKICQIRDIRNTQTVPDFADEFTQRLYATYLSFMEKKHFAYPLQTKTDERGSLFEWIKSKHFGQVFVSKTRKGIVRGNHYHNTKVEKFCVIQGKAMIKLRSVFSKEIISYPVSGKKIEMVDIPPGYTHSIENLSDGEMIVLFWASQIFDPKNPDTYPLEV